MATYYKVVRVNRWGEYRSAVIDGKACLRYALGERTEGFEGMPVLLFEDQQAASDFAKRERGYRKALYILAGKAGRPRRQRFICQVYRGLGGFRAFWRGSPTRHWPAPNGTYAADWFEPKRVVDRP